ncbi:MAG: helix-turn-helix domain-containing protein [Nitrospirales bacterium]
MGIINDSKKQNLNEAACFLGISPHTLRAWTRERRIAFHRCGRRLVFAVTDLERFLADNRVEARADDDAH